MARCGRSCESRFRQNFRKSFDWLSFNQSFLESAKGHRIAIAIDPCYISKSGKKTPGIDWFWSGCAAVMKKGLEILGISIVDADVKDSVFLKAEQTFTDKKRGRKPDCTKGMKDPGSLTGWYLRIAEDIAFKVGNSIQKFQLSVSLDNVGNMINSNWGVEKWSCYQTAN